MAESPPRVWWERVPVIVRAIITGLLIGLAAANVWPLLLLHLGAPVASCVEVFLLVIYVFWTAGGGPPERLRAVRAENFRATRLSARQWMWGCTAAASFAVTIHAAIVLLFRIVPYPAGAFHRGYDFSFIPTRQEQWLAVVISALSAAVCEETGFRGYMQRPIEKRHGAFVAIAISTFMFMLLHLNKGWALIGMVPIVFGAGVLLGTLARASGTLVFCMLGHWIMDIGLFAYWWTQIAGTFNGRPISETGLDSAFYLDSGIFVIALAILLFSTARLLRLRGRVDGESLVSTSGNPATDT